MPHRTASTTSATTPKTKHGARRRGAKNRLGGGTIYRDDVRSFRDDRDVRGAAGLSTTQHSLGHRFDQVDAGQRAIFPAQAGGVEVYGAATHRFQLHLRLPFVDFGMALAADICEEALDAAREQTALRIAVLRRS